MTFSLSLDARHKSDYSDYLLVVLVVLLVLGTTTLMAPVGVTCQF